MIAQSFNDKQTEMLKRKQKTLFLVHFQVHIINLLQDSKFQHFKPVMDTYIESHFAGALSYRYGTFQPSSLLREHDLIRALWIFRLVNALRLPPPGGQPSERHVVLTFIFFSAAKIKCKHRHTHTHTHILTGCLLHTLPAS